MRDLLAPLVGYRHQFRAVAARLGNDDRGRLTLLLTDVTWVGGCLASDHLWVRYGPEWAAVARSMGQRVAFRADVRPYRRGDGTRDYTLATVEGVRVVGRAG